MKVLAVDMHLPFLPLCFCCVISIVSKGQNRKLQIFSFFFPWRSPRNNAGVQARADFADTHVGLDQ